MADKTEFKVDQNIDVILNMPESIKRNEIFTLNITVFNRINERLQDI